MVVPHKALKPRWKSANVSTRWLAQVAVSARPKRNGVMMRCRRQNFASVPQALSRGSEKHPLELVSDHAQLSVIHRGLLSLSLQQHTQEEFRMDRNKNLQQK